jgi:hypothetical protein
VEEAYSMIEHLHQEGEKRGFTFECFLEKHNQAFLELSCYNEPILKSKMVRDFLTQINALELAAAKKQIKARPIISMRLPIF